MVTSLPPEKNMRRFIPKVIDHVFKVCPIPPKPRTRALFLSPLFSKFVTMVLVPALILSTLLVVFLAPTISLQQSIHPDWSWSVHHPGKYTYIDVDCILYNRPFVNVSEFDVNDRDTVINQLSLGRFTLRTNETAVWRNCTIYTFQASQEDLTRLGYTLKYVRMAKRNPETGQLQYSKYTNIGLELASTIVLTDNANLTLINVAFSDYVTIRLQDTASLTMINCTNVGYSWTIQTNDYWEWPSGRSGGGRYRRPEGIIEVQDNATVWIEGTTVGRLIGTQYAVEGGIRPGYCAAATLIDSRIHEVRIRGQTPIRIIDSAVHELYADTGDVEQLGTTAVTYQLPFLQHDEWFHDCGRGPDIAYRSSIRVEKPAYQWGEPIRMTVFIENLGFQPFTLDFNGSDSFYITIYNTTSTYHVVYEYHPDQSMIPPKRVIEPGEVAAFTLTWRQDPPVAPGQYTVRCSEDLNTLQAWFSAGGTSFIVTNEPYAGD
jgi:hypothetical protein